mgnify:CR=1 FL=1
MHIIKELTKKWGHIQYPFLIHSNGELFFKDIIRHTTKNLDLIQPSDVVALIGDFDPKTISIMLNLMEKDAIIVPLTKDTKDQHNYFFDSAAVKYVFEYDKFEIINKSYKKNDLLINLQSRNKGGIILFSSGTTAKPKAILHNLDVFLKRFNTPRPTLRTINFLLFDHIGGINTLFHTLFNLGTIIVPDNRKIDTILSVCEKYNVELLPTTPTFLRLLIIGGYVPQKIPKSLKIITYGTERMDQFTLDRLCSLLPKIDFRQTYGMSELGIFRIKSKSRNSLFMKVGGEGVETRIVNNMLEIKSKNRMEGYLNAKSPFDADGWYRTEDIVDQDGEYIKITGRGNEIINVGGLKFMASEVEREILSFEGVKFASVIGKDNPITGQHTELIVEKAEGFNLDKKHLKKFLTKRLPKHMIPSRIQIKKIN